MAEEDGSADWPAGFDAVNTVMNTCQPVPTSV